MSDSVGGKRSTLEDLTATPSVAGLMAADLSVDGVRPTDADGWLTAFRTLAASGDVLLMRESQLWLPRRRRPGDDGGLLVAPRHDGGPRGPRTSPANARFERVA